MGLLLNYKYYMYNEFDDLEPSIEIVTPKFEALWYIIERRFEFRAAQYGDVSDSAGTPRTGRLGHRAVASSTLILCFIEPRSSTNASPCQPVCRRTPSSHRALVCSELHSCDFTKDYKC